MVNRDALRGKAQTVLGIVNPATLGLTLMHEHARGRSEGVLWKPLFWSTTIGGASK